MISNLLIVAQAVGIIRAWVYMELSMEITAFFGFLAAFLTTVAFIPQVIQIWRSKHTKDISLGMYSIFTAGILAWLAYGILLGSTPIIIANSITIVLAGSVLAMKLKYG
jgi:MtN3 and saliva related transmembrane protein